MPLRYPHIQPFQTEEAALFFNRAAEVEKLYHHVQLGAFVLLFGRAGVGKTSFIQAGVAPKLVEEDYYPVFVDLAAKTTTPTKLLQQVVEKVVAGEGIAEAVQEQLHFFIGDRSPSVWEYLKACAFEVDDVPAIPVLIFDDFDQLFKHDAAQRQDFVQLLANLIYGAVPERVQQTVRDIPRKERTARHQAWREPLDWKLILVVRTDHLDEVDDLSKQIPAILDHRFQLKLLDKQQAALALTGPAVLPGDFDSPVFSYSADLLEVITAHLANKKGEIDPFSLQIVAHFIEKEVIGQALAPATELGPEVLDVGIPNILFDYYHSYLQAELNENERNLTSRIMEQSLVVNGSRVSLAEPILIMQYGATPELLDKLVKSGLLRTTPSHLGKTYEIANDSLALPIFEAFKKRQAAERAADLAAVAAKHEENERRMSEENAQKELNYQERIQRQRWSLFAFASLFVLVAVSTAFAFYQWHRASQLHLKYTKDAFEDSYHKAIGLHFIENEYDEPIIAYERAIKDAKEHGQLTDSIPKLEHYVALCTSKLEDKPDMRKALSLVDEQLAQDSLVNAMEYCAQALALDYNTTRVWEIVRTYRVASKHLAVNNQQFRQLMLEMYRYFKDFYTENRSKAKLAYTTSGGLAMRSYQKRLADIEHALDYYQK